MPDIMSPGAYLAKRRRAAGLSIDDVAAMIGSDPDLKEADRRTWLAQIEADITPIGRDIVTTLRHTFPFSIAILTWLAAIHMLCFEEHPFLCAQCGCSQYDPCVGADGETCAWAPVPSGAPATHTPLCTFCQMETSHAA
ncbi:MAG: XRE family transcriptional regulator [Sphingobium sp.]|nr:XRE family transcriptional regulator [Sphingobium sp.]